MQKEKTASKQPAARDNKFDRTPEVDQEEPAIEDDGSPVLDEQDLEENHISEEEADNIEWDEENDDNQNRQGIDKMPGQEMGKGDKVTMKNLKGKQVDGDPSTEEGKPLDI